MEAPQLTSWEPHSKINCSSSINPATNSLGSRIQKLKKMNGSSGEQWIDSLHWIPLPARGWVPNWLKLHGDLLGQSSDFSFTLARRSRRPISRRATLTALLPNIRIAPAAQFVPQDLRSSLYHWPNIETGCLRCANRVQAIQIQTAIFDEKTM